MAHYRTVYGRLCVGGLRWRALPTGQLAGLWVDAPGHTNLEPMEQERGEKRQMAVVKFHLSNVDDLQVTAMCPSGVIIISGEHVTVRLTKEQAETLYHDLNVALHELDYGKEGGHEDNQQS
jgi:hypothetical protein